MGSFGVCGFKILSFSSWDSGFERENGFVTVKRERERERERERQRGSSGRVE